MTVAELIEKLSALDQTIVIDVYNGSVVGIYVDDDGSVILENS